MLNKTENKAARRKSIVATRTKKSFISFRAFAKFYKGNVVIRKIGATYFCGFNSIINRQRSHAWGGSFEEAYRNMLRNFNIKYAA